MFSSDNMAVLAFVLSCALFSSIASSFVLFPSDLTQTYVPIFALQQQQATQQQVNPYAIAQQNDILRKLNQFFGCPFCCPICEEAEAKAAKDEDEEIKELVYSPVEEELTVLNVVPLKTTEKSIFDDAEELVKRNQIAKDFLEENAGTVKKEKPEILLENGVNKRNQSIAG